MTIDPRDPDALIDAACKTMQAVERINELPDAEKDKMSNLVDAVSLMLQAVTAEATLALAIYAQRGHRPMRVTFGDDRK